MSLLVVEDLTRRYGSTTVVDHVSFTINRGETLGLVGESGSGKSTIARMVLGLTPADEGTVQYDGEHLSSRGVRAMRSLRRRMQPVFQDPFAALNPRMRIAQIVTEPLLIHGATRGRSTLRDRAAGLLADVGLDASALDRFPHEFSGGQRQRINIARALALDPEFLVLDEPVSALDVSVGAQVINLLARLQRERQLTCLFISHSMPLVRYFASRIAVLRKGRLVEIGSREDICSHPQAEYTRALLAATPEVRLEGLAGN